MEKILYLLHTETDGSISRVGLEGLTAVRESLLAKDFTVAILGKDAQKATGLVAGCGAVKIYTIEGDDFSVSRYASDAYALTEVVKKSESTLIVAPTTARFSRVLPGVAGRTNGTIDTHINGLSLEGDNIQVKRWFYRQRMVATFSKTKRPWFLVIDSGIFTPFKAEGDVVGVEKLDLTLPAEFKRTEIVGVEAPSADAATIKPDADLLFVAGAGWTKKQADGQIHIKDAEGHILTFLSKAQASLGSSKSLVDQSSEGQEVLTCMSHLNQVGQTGSTPRHPKGLSTCCHGEEPHTVGWRFINERRAINLDPNCGWAQGKTDVLYVADAFEVMKKVNELLG